MFFYLDDINYNDLLIEVNNNVYVLELRINNSEIPNPQKFE